MSARRPISCSVLAASVLLALSPTTARTEQPADKEAQAAERFDKAVDLYTNGDVEAALIEFKRAYELAPTYQLLFNLGQVAAQLKDYLAALGYFEQYLTEGGKRISSERRARSRREIVRLSTLVGRLDLNVSVDGARIHLDGRFVGTSPLEKPILANAGNRTVVVTRSGYLAWEKIIELAGQEVEEVVVTLSSRERVETETNLPDVKNDSGFGPAFWTSATITTALAVATGVSLYFALEAKDDYDQELIRIPTTPEAIEKSGDKLRRWTIATDVGTGLTVVGSALTLALGLRARNSSDRSPVVSLSADGFAVSGRF